VSALVVDLDVDSPDVEAAKIQARATRQAARLGVAGVVPTAFHFVVGIRRSSADEVVENQ
jgi:hypothetical protein